MIRRWMMPAVAGVLLLTAGGCARHTDQVSLREPDTASRMRIAATAAAAGQTEIALSMYSAAAEAAPNDPAVQARLVSMLLRIGKPEVAQQTLTRALTSQPRDPTLLRWLGNLRLETGSPEAALTIFDGLIARNAKDVASLNGRGVALDLLSQHDQAQESYRRAQAIAPADVQTANNLAVSYLLADRPSQARDVLLPLSQQSELPPRVLNNLAIAQAATGSAGTSSAGTSTTISSDDLRTLATSLGAGIALDTPAMQSLRADKPAG